MHEYKEFAKYYDQFYQKKDYQKEVLFLTHFLTPKSHILDVGCGTGIHASLLEEKDFKVDGVDFNQEMLDIAKTRMKGQLFLQNVLDLNIPKKYDAIISMFAVMNHLHSIEELRQALIKMRDYLKEDGIIMIDLHNPQASGEKTDMFGNIKRKMIWEYDAKKQIETSQILFTIDNTTYHDKHIFRIFTIDEVKEVAKSVGLEVLAVYENYDYHKKGVKTSKNLQFLMHKI